MEDISSPYATHHSPADARPWPPKFRPQTREAVLHALAGGMDVDQAARECDCSEEPVRALVMQLALDALGLPDIDQEAAT